jgi:hypothetical protein
VQNFLEPVNFFDCVVMCEGGPYGAGFRVEPKTLHQARRVHMAGADAEMVSSKFLATVAGGMFLRLKEKVGTRWEICQAHECRRSRHLRPRGREASRERVPARKLGSRPSLESCDRAANRTARPD